MKITLAMVSSLDGKTTRWSDAQDVSQWASDEDQVFFLSLIERHDVIVMGRKTYDSVKHRLRFDGKKLRVVLTRNPGKYSAEAKSGELEFTGEKPEELALRLEQKGYKELLLVGGGLVNSAFLKANIVDEIYLTVEPKIFGNGRLMVEGQPLDINLNLIEVQKINDKGTLLLRYRVEN